MRTLQPKRDYLRLFEAIVLDVWKQQRTDSKDAHEALTKRLEAIRHRSNQLTDAFIYDKSIDRETYQLQLARLREDQVLVEMELNDTKVEQLDVEAAVSFALYAIGDASRFWLDAPIEQKQRFQRAIFPSGLRFDGQEFETAATCLAFTYLQEVSARKSSLASRTGFEPVLPP